MNNKGKTGFTTYLVAGVSIAALLAIALMSLVGDMKSTSESPEAYVERQPPAAIPPDQAADTAVAETAPPPAVAVATPSGQDATAAPPLAPAAGPESAVADSAAQARTDLLAMLEGWRKAWANRDVEAYFSFYAADYAGNADTPADWQASRRRIIGKAGLIDITLGEADIEMDGEDRAILTFPMTYRSKQFEDEGTKQLLVVRDQGKWRIAQEQFTASN